MRWAQCGRCSHFLRVRKWWRKMSVLLISVSKSGQSRKFKTPQSMMENAKSHHIMSLWVYCSCTEHLHGKFMDNVRLYEVLRSAKMRTTKLMDRLHCMMIESNEKEKEIETASAVCLAIFSVYFPFSSSIVVGFQCFGLFIFCFFSSLSLCKFDTPTKQNDRMKWKKYETTVCVPVCRVHVHKFLQRIVSWKSRVTLTEHVKCASK